MLESVHGLLQELALPVVLGQHLLLDAGGVQVLLTVGTVQLLHSFLQGPGGLDVLHSALQVPLETPEATSTDNHRRGAAVSRAMQKKKEEQEEEQRQQEEERRRRRINHEFYKSAWQRLKHSDAGKQEAEGEGKAWKSSTGSGCCCEGSGCQRLFLKKRRKRVSDDLVEILSISILAVTA